MKKKRLIPWLLCFLLVFATSPLIFLDQAQAAPTQTAGKAENYTGWKTISGQKYYYRNGKALKGLKKVGKYYYFLKQGAKLQADIQGEFVFRNSGGNALCSGGVFGFHLA